MKKILALCLATVVALSCTRPVAFAAPMQDGITSSSSQSMVISDPMAFEEMIQQYASVADISYVDALHFFPMQMREAGPSYRTLSVTINATNTYKPTLEFYCETQEGTSSWGITSIYSIQLNRSDGGISKQFAGDIQAWLRGAYQIEYVINGDFYNNGTTSVGSSVGGSGGIGDLVQVSYNTSISTSGNHYSYCYQHDTQAFQS